ncbi:MAG TPA: lysophospholipid acyltransferase family protein [Herminiimonas sp.]|nr:lysophospholipid acyltransferase family protein [Herminiimonas sp.]
MLVFLFRLLSLLPLPILHAIGVVMGWVVYLVTPGYRRRLKENITRAGFAEHLHAAIGEAGKTFLELPFMWCASPQRLLSKTKLENWDMVQALIDKHQGMIFLTPHLGCFEMLAQEAGTRMQLAVLYRPPKQAALRPLVEKARARNQLTLAPANLSGVRMLLKILKKKGSIGLLPDQVPQFGEGVWADFFGKPAYTMTLPAKMHDMTGAPIILAYAERLPRGKGYSSRFIHLDLPEGLSPEQQARAINGAMEDVIAQCPAQYFWSYNRYKKPSGVAAPTAVDQRAAS